MINRVHLRADMQQMKREPIMLLFALLSLLLIGVFKGIVSVGAPILYDYTGIDLMTYEMYMVAMVYMLQPLMLGTVMGFFMLDEKDARIFELLRVTPLGISGYLMNRLLLPVLLTVVYTLVGYVVLGMKVHGLLALISILVFLSFETVGIGLFIVLVSEDKVKGLTNAKVVSAMVVFGFVNLIPLPAVQTLGRFAPQYYITAIISSMDISSLLVGILVHILWLGLVIRLAFKRL